MTAAELATLVADMRRLQKEYFRTRSATALEQSKQLERQVDKAVDQMLRQPSLFGE
jgi:phosphate uptake regulator